MKTRIKRFAFSIGVLVWTNLCLFAEECATPEGAAGQSSGFVILLGNGSGAFHVAATYTMSDLTDLAVRYVDADRLALLGAAPQLVHASATTALRKGNRFSCSVPSQIGRDFRLEYENSLTDKSWIALPLVAGNGRVLTLIDPTASDSERLYRIRRW
jgi:hypothetical protein